MRGGDPQPSPGADPGAPRDSSARCSRSGWLGGRELFAGPLAILLVSVSVGWLGGPSWVSLPLALFAIGWAGVHLFGLDRTFYRRQTFAAPPVLTPDGVAEAVVDFSGQDLGAPPCALCAETPWKAHGCISCGELIDDPCYCWLGLCQMCWEAESDREWWAALQSL